MTEPEQGELFDPATLVPNEPIDITPESHPHMFEPGADPKTLTTNIAEEFGLPKDSQLDAILQRIIDESGHQVPLAYLMMVAAMCGGTIQLLITNNDDIEPFELV